MENTKEINIETTIADINLKIKEIENDLKKAIEERDDAFETFKHFDVIHSGLEKELAKAYDEYCDARNRNDFVMMSVYKLKMSAIDKECCSFREKIENDFFNKKTVHENKQKVCEDRLKKLDKLKKLVKLYDELKFMNSMAKKNLEEEERLIKNKICGNKECNNSDEMQDVWKAYFKECDNSDEMQKLWDALF